MGNLSFVTRLCCNFVNWDPEILQECSRASICQVKKLAFAMTIVLCIWGFNGFAIGSMFLHLPFFACCLLSAALIFLVWLIENVIALSIGGNWMMKSVRFGLGCLMALLGSVLVDHYFFKEDIDSILQADLELKIKEETVILEHKYAADMEEQANQMDLLRLQIEDKDAKIAANPFLTKRDYKKEATGEVDEKGLPVFRVVESTETKSENPLVASRQADMDLLAKYEAQFQDSRMRKLNAANEAATKFSDVQSAGFLKMIDATVRVVKQSIWNKVAYSVFFGIMLFLELFVMLVKFGDKGCDYDKILEQQLRLKNSLLEARQLACSV